MEAILATITSMIEGISSVVELVIFGVSSFATEIVSDPLLLMLVVAVPLCGIGAGMLRRLISTN